FPIVLRWSRAPRVALGRRLRLNSRRPARTWWRWPVPSAGWRHLMTGSKRLRAPPLWCRSTSRTGTVWRGLRPPLPSATRGSTCGSAKAGVLGPLSPLSHVEPNDWDNLIAVNVTANWQLIRCMDSLLQRSQAGRAIFLTSTVAYLGRAYWGPYAASKTALDALVRTYAAENATTNVRANLFAPGPTRTRMYLSAFPGADPATLPTPEKIAKAILPLCLPECSESGKIYDFRAQKFLNLHSPA